MAEDFSYATDIAPMQSRFISDVSGSRNLSTRTKQKVIGGILDKQLAQAQELAKIEDMRNTAKMREIQYKSSLMSLEEQRRKAAEQKEIYKTALPELNARLQEAVAEPDREKRIGMISSIGINNAFAIANNPVADQAFRSASYGASITPAKPSRTVGDLVREGATSKDLEGVDISDPEKPVPLDVAVRFNERRLRTALEKEALDKKNEAEIKAADNKRQAQSRQFISNRTTLLDEEVDPLPFVSSLAQNIGTKEDKELFGSLKKEFESVDRKDFTKRREIAGKIRNLGIGINNRIDPLAPKEADTAPSKGEKARGLFTPRTP